MKKERTVEREKVFEGLKAEILQETYHISINNTDLDIKIADFYDNPLKKLRERIVPEKFNLLLEKNEFEQEATLKTFQTKDKLDVFYCIKSGRLFLFSFGEFEPSRYVCYLEDIEKFYEMIELEENKAPIIRVEEPRVYKGKTYTQAEWEVLEAQLWKAHKKATGYVSDEDRDPYGKKQTHHSRFLYDEEDEQRELNEKKGIFLGEKKKKGFWDIFFG